MASDRGRVAEGPCGPVRRGGEGARAPRKGEGTLTKQVHIKAAPRLRLNESMLGVLQMIDEAGGQLSASVSSIGERVGIRGASARRVLHRLDERGYVRVEKCFLPNGGQLESSYTITPAGQEVLAAWRSQEDEESEPAA